MKSNLLRTFFEWALITSVLMSVLFFFWFLVKSHESRDYEVQIARAQAHLEYNGARMAALGVECRAYARTNADMARLLTPSAAPAASSKGGK